LLNYPQALLAVEREIAALPAPSDGDAWIVLAEQTIECSFGWIIFYGSRRYAETGDFVDLVAGNVPLIVDRHDGTLNPTGTAFPIEHYIEEYKLRVAHRRNTT